jgi:hypothetical protein
MSGPCERRCSCRCFARPSVRSSTSADGVQGDPIVLGTDQEIQPGERSIEKSCRAMAG